MSKPTAGGGWKAIGYTLEQARRAGGLWRMLKALKTRNACKTCALGMGGQQGGMVNEGGHFPAVCKKSVQAMMADMQGAIRGDFFARFTLDELEAFSPRELESAGRLTQPLYAGPDHGHYEPIGWDEAIDRLTAKMKTTQPKDSFFYFSGRSSNEASFLLQFFARLWGTNNINNCSYYCHQASGVGLNSVYGSGTASVVLDDIHGCDLFFLLGGNPASNHPRLMHSLLRMKRRGGTVVIINPLKELGLVRFKVPSDFRSLLFGTDIADEYIQPHIGGDSALLAGIGKIILATGAIDHRFMDDHTDGWPRFKEFLQQLTWNEIESQSGVLRSTIERVAWHYAHARNVIFSWAMGITHHDHGVQNVQMIANLAMMRGMLGKTNAGLLPLRGHSNVQGVGSVGATPLLKGPVLERLQQHFRVQLPTEPGMDTMACIEKASKGDIDLAWCLGGNLYASNPDSQFAADALNKIGMSVYLSTTLNTGHFHGRGRETIILPVLARDEESQATTQESMFNFVRVSDGGPTRHSGPRSEIDVVASIADRVIGDSTAIDFASLQDHDRIREAIANVIPGYEAVRQAGNTKKEFYIAGRTLHKPTFNTPTGRAQFHVSKLPGLKGAANQLRLMTIRSEGQFNTVVYEEEDIYRGQERRDVILMHKDDIKRLNLQLDQPVTVRSETGQLDNILVRRIDIRPGNAAMYYPEANVLVPRTSDAKSKTPAFKCIAVTVTQCRAGTQLPLLSRV